MGLFDGDIKEEELETIIFPYSLTPKNMNQAKLRLPDEEFPIVVNDFLELLNRLKSIYLLNDMSNIIAHGINPYSLFSDNTRRYLQLYSKVNQFGITFFYSNDDEIPNDEFESLRIIKGEINRFETEELNKTKNEIKKQKKT